MFGCLRSPPLFPMSLCLYPETPPPCDSVTLASTSGSPSPRLPPLPQSRSHEGPTPQQGSLDVPGYPEYPCGAVNHGFPSPQSCGALSLSVMSHRSRRRQCRRRWAQRSSGAACPIRMSCWDMRHHPRGLPHRPTIPWLSAVRGSQTPHFHLSKNGICLWLIQQPQGLSGAITDVDIRKTCKDNRSTHIFKYI